MKMKIPYLIFALLLLAIRLSFNFKEELIPGINGGYYPVQIRTLLETGKLGFPDMPLYFYLNAGIVKLFSFLTKTQEHNWIITTCKTIDSFTLPLIIIPLYLIQKNILKQSAHTPYSLSLLGFATLSFSPLMLTSDLQKNALAIPLLMLFIYGLLIHIKTRSKKHLLLVTGAIILIALTHFGAFVIAVMILILSFFIFAPKKALLLAPLAAGTGWGLVWLFDPQRASRILDIWEHVFNRPIITQAGLSPPEWVNLFISGVLIASGIIFLIAKRKSVSSFNLRAIILFLGVIFILCFPWFDVEYARRFGLFLFVPQWFAFALLGERVNLKLKRAYTSILIGYTAVSLFLVFGHIKPPSITHEAFKDLENIRPTITNPEETLVIARHGLEWWTAWQLHTKVGQDKSIDAASFEKYQKIIVLVQLKGKRKMNPRKKSPFHEPSFPILEDPFFRSAYFEAREMHYLPRY
jgi:hypothetical protein